MIHIQDLKQEVHNMDQIGMVILKEAKEDRTMRQLKSR